MQKFSELLYNRYLISSKNIQLIKNQESIYKYKKSKNIGEVFIFYMDNASKNTLYITEKGLFSYAKSATFSLGWSEFKSLSLGYNGNSIFLGGLLFYTHESKQFYSFFKELQAYLNHPPLENDMKAFELLNESMQKMKIIEEKLDFYISVVGSLSQFEKVIK